MMDEAIKREIVNYRRQKAYNLMHDVDILIENELWNSTVNRLYYACFHIITALLIMHGIEVKTHMGVRQAFGLHFVKSGILEPQCGRIFSRIYDKRQSSDYDDCREFTREEVENLYPQIQLLIEKVDKLIQEAL